MSDFLKYQGSATGTLQEALALQDAHAALAQHRLTPKNHGEEQHFALNRRNKGQAQLWRMTAVPGLQHLMHDASQIACCRVECGTCNVIIG